MTNSEIAHVVCIYYQSKSDRTDIFFFKSNFGVTILVWYQEIICDNYEKNFLLSKNVRGSEIAHVVCPYYQSKCIITDQFFSKITFM